MNRNFIAAFAVFLGLCAYPVSSVLAHDNHGIETITLTDAEGRTVVVPHGAQRVLLGFYYEDFYAITGDNAYDRVVAICKEVWAGWRSRQYEAYVAVAPRIAELIDIGYEESGGFNIETAIAAEPDVAILASWQMTAIGEAGMARFEAAGIPVVVVDYNAQTLERHLASTIAIGQVMATEERAEALAREYEAAVKDVEARLAGITQRPAAYVELGRKGPAEFGNSYGNTMWGRVIETAGGNNIAASQIENWGPLNPEYIIASAPQVVFLAGSDWSGPDAAVIMGFGVTEEVTRERIAAYMTRPGWEHLPAVETHQVHALYHGGARTLYDYTFLQYMAKAMHPEVFADVDPVANHRSFYERWLPLPADGAFMLSVN